MIYLKAEFPSSVVWLVLRGVWVLSFHFIAPIHTKAGGNPFGEQH